MAITEKEKIVKSDVAFTSEQMSIIQKMLDEVKSNSRSGAESISVYNARDPKSIETVNVRRIDGKFVVGLKNHNKDPFKKKPQYCIYKGIPERGLLNEPFVTLILSDDGKTFEEKEMSLIDYVSQRDKIKCDVVKIEVKEIIVDHGILGSTGEYAIAVDSKGLPEARPTILAQVKHEERVFHVTVPGFEQPYQFITDFLS